MSPLMTMGAVSAAVVVVLAVVYARSSGREQREYARRLAALRPGDVSAMSRECIAEYAARLDRRLDLADLDGSARVLDECLSSLAAMLVLAAEGRNLRGAELAGAFMGELIRHHAPARWSLDGKSPALTLSTPNGLETVSPFIHTFNHFKAGTRGDLHALVVDVVERGRRGPRGRGQ